MNLIKMKPHSSFLALFFVLLACSEKKPTPSTRPELTGDLRTDVMNLLPEGEVIVDIMDKIKINPRREELMAKFQQGIQNNYEWYVDYLKEREMGVPMPYHENFGMTEGEFSELQGLMDKIEVESSDQSILEIKRDQNSIRFQGFGRLFILNDTQIDLVKNQVKMGKTLLAFSDTVQISDTNNALNSPWKGYTWRYEYPENANLDILKDLQNLEVRVYKFTVGRLEKSGKTFLSVSAKEIKNGVKEVELDLPLVF